MNVEYRPPPCTNQEQPAPKQPAHYGPTPVIYSLVRQVLLAIDIRRRVGFLDHLLCVRSFTSRRSLIWLTKGFGIDRQNGRSRSSPGSSRSGMERHAPITAQWLWVISLDMKCRTYANGLRTALDELDLTKVADSIRSLGATTRPARTLREAKELAAIVVNGYTKRAERLYLALQFFDIPVETGHKILYRWEASGVRHSMSLHPMRHTSSRSRSSFMLLSVHSLSEARGLRTGRIYNSIPVLPSLQSYFCVIRRPAQTMRSAVPQI